MTGSQGTPHEDEDIIAREHARGVTLRSWMAGDHPLSDRLEMVRRAARGLAAAHDQGIVHRDFKPDNAIVGEDGRLRVVDSGLATRPADMAPELRAGASPGAKGDQFALCVSAWEVLFGHHPLVGRRDGAPAPTPEGTEVSPRIVEALRRGLSRDPKARHPDLRALLDALEDPPARGRKLGWLAAVAAFSLIGAGMFAMRSDASDDSTTDAEAALDVSACVLYLDDARRAMTDSLALAEEEMADLTLTTIQRAQARERHGAIRLALGQWEEGCAELSQAFDGFEGSRARWRLT